MARAAKVRKWHVDQALASVRSLLDVLSELTAAEIRAALKLESESRRRSTIQSRLLSRLSRLAELEFQHTTKEQYLGSST